MIANKAVADLSVMLKDDKNICILTSQWLLGMISAIDSDKMDALCRRMLNIATLEKICNGFWIPENIRFTVNVDARVLQKV